MSEAITSLSTLLISFILTVLLERALIPILSKSAKQPIYEGGPAWHLVKSGTPTMGGLAFIIVATPMLALLSFYLFSIGKSANALTLLLTLLFSLSNAAIGIVDDLTKLKHKKNAGLSPKQKLVFQFLVTTLYLLLIVRVLNISTSVALPIGKINFGFLYYPLVVVMLVGFVNCANLTDGIDGLASSVAFAISISLILLTRNQIPEISYACLVVVGITLGFLIFNFHPAKIFMGDTGSLFLGALIASLGMSMSNPFIIILIGGVYVIEGISVILQVFFFKTTGKRLFKMAPIHHHFEKIGLSEIKICIIAVTATALFSAIAYWLI